MTGTSLETWQGLIQDFKQAVAKRLWSLPAVAEAEKELIFKELLQDLDSVEKSIGVLFEQISSQEKASLNENELLRSLMGLPEDETRLRILSLGAELKTEKERSAEFEEQNEILTKRCSEALAENELLRKRLREVESGSRLERENSLVSRDRDIRFYSENNESLRNQLLDLESRLVNLRSLFTESNQQFAQAKQEEIALLQKKILEEMEEALKKKQQLAWAEEEMFAKGVAQKLRTELVSAQGQLFLALERLGLLDPESKTESFWKARFRLLMDGADSLAENFRAIQAQIQGVTQSLDNYLHLTHRREMRHEDVLITDLVNRQLAEVYVDRQPTLSVEFVPDDPLPAVDGDAEMLQFVIRALIENAIESLPNKSGRVVITAKNSAQRGRVEIIVRDSGPGIPEHLRARVFQPFFTTKPNRQGLTLSRARKFAELHGGELVLVSTSSEGTLFRLELPIKGRTTWRA